MHFSGKSIHLIVIALISAKEAVNAGEIATGLLDEEDNAYWGRLLQAESSLPLPCDVKVDISCVTKDGTECTDIVAEPAPGECMEIIDLTYTVSNTGETTETIDSLTRTLNAVFEDLTDGLESAVLLPGESTVVKESAEISLCEAMTFTIEAEVEASPPSGPSCSDDDNYTFTPKVICDCDCDVAISCQTLDGIECRMIPPAETTEECVIDIEYTYTVSNFGSTNSQITTLTRERDGETKDLFPLLDTTELPPDGSTDVSETEEINICTGATFVTKAFLTTNCLHCTSRPERALEALEVKERLYTLKTGSNKGLRQ